MRGFTLIEMLVAFAILGIVISIVVFGSADYGRHERLMRECIQDGRKEYQCEAMLKDNSNVVLLPMPQ